MALLLDLLLPEWSLCSVHTSCVSLGSFLGRGEKTVRVWFLSFTEATVKRRCAGVGNEAQGFDFHSCLGKLVPLVFWVLGRVRSTQMPKQGMVSSPVFLTLMTISIRT